MSRAAGSAACSAPLLLDPYAARSCPVKTQNAHDPLVPRPDLALSDELVEVFAGIDKVRDQVLDVLARAPGALDLRGAEHRAEATVRALGQRVEVLVGPLLPPDVEGHRSGQPDAMVLAPDGLGYWPVLVKNKRMLEARHAPEACTVTPLDQPRSTALPSPDQTPRAGRDRDLIQAAHHLRLLEGLGLAHPRPLAGIVGTDGLGVLDGAQGITWVNLHHRFIRTFSRTAQTNWRLRSPLERYDHEFGFRVAVASNARTNDGSGHYRPMVWPIVVRECENCPWWSTCKPALDDEDLSLRISRSPLDVREISVLRRLGISTLAELAEADLEALLPAYLPEVAHRTGPEQRLRTAARRAQMIRDRVELSRLDDSTIRVPSGQIEVDLDIETAEDDSIYLWGLLVDDTSTDEPATYHGFVAWQDLDAAGQVALAREAMELLESLFDSGRSVVVYHYSDYERVHLRKLALDSADPVLQAAVERFDQWCDLFTIVRNNFFGVNGLGLKVVATVGAGFHWRDDDPGGLNSQRWFRDAVHAEQADQREAARLRVLEYNEDDVLATHALRRWLRSEHAATSH